MANFHLNILGAQKAAKAQHLQEAYVNDCKSAVMEAFSKTLLLFVLMLHEDTPPGILYVLLSKAAFPMTLSLTLSALLSLSTL